LAGGVPALSAPPSHEVSVAPAAVVVVSELAIV
jgi:hypothetical protein